MTDPSRRKKDGAELGGAVNAVSHGARRGTAHNMCGRVWPTLATTRVVNYSFGLSGHLGRGEGSGRAHGYPHPHRSVALASFRGRGPAACARSYCCRTMNPSSQEACGGCVCAVCLLRFPALVLSRGHRICRLVASRCEPHRGMSVVQQRATLLP